MHKKLFKYLFILISMTLLTSCSMKNNQIDIKEKLKIPKTFNDVDHLTIKDDWLLKLLNKELINLINLALNDNFELQRLSYDVKIQKQKLISSKSSFFPSIDLSLKESKNGNFEGINNASLSKVSLSVNYEVDLWGKLSVLEKQANVNILTAQANFEQKKQELIHDILLSYYNIQESNLLLEIYSKQIKNKKNSYDLLKSQYIQGISNLADTYLAQNSIYDKMKQIATLKVSKKKNIYQLENLLSRYPKGLFTFNSKLPLIKGNIKIGIPSSLILRKPSLVASWNTLLAQNYQLAFAHKQRLPSLSLSASLDKTTQSGTPIAWSLLAGITAPIFDAGKLKANEEIERLELKKAELSYLDNIYTAFINIENNILESKSLNTQYEIVLKSLINAKKSEDISLDQYKQGLIVYSSVISTQDTSFNLEIEKINLKKKILANKLALHLSLGGDFVSNKILKDKKK